MPYSLMIMSARKSNLTLTAPGRIVRAREGRTPVLCLTVDLLGLRSVLHRTAGPSIQSCSPPPSSPVPSLSPPPLPPQPSQPAPPSHPPPWHPPPSIIARSRRLLPGCPRDGRRLRSRRRSGGSSVGGGVNLVGGCLGSGRVRRGRGSWRVVGGHREGEDGHRRAAANVRARTHSMAPRRAARERPEHPSGPTVATPVCLLAVECRTRMPLRLPLAVSPPPLATVSTGQGRKRGRSRPHRHRGGRKRPRG